MIRLWRWIIVVAAVGLSIGLESFEHHTLWEGELLAEMVVGALLVPTATWILLTWLARELDQRTAQQVALERRRNFMHGLAQCPDWEEVTQFIVAAPAEWLPVRQVTLSLFDVAAGQLQRLRTWQSAEVLAAGAADDVPERLCLTCRLPRLRHLSRCEYQSAAPGRQEEEYCVPLTQDNLLVGLLRLGFPAGQAIADDQAELLTSLAPEMALALVRTLGMRGQVAQARTAAQTYERREIAQVLHNSLAHQIGYLHLNLGHLAGDERLLQCPDLTEEMRHMRDVSGEAYDRIRDTLAFLRSQEEADLNEAIANLVAAVARTAGLEVVVTTQGDPQLLPPPIARKVFRLIQEGLNNVTKHAQAQHVELRLRWHSAALELSITDDGTGFSPAAVNPADHYGLMMLRETAAELGGQLNIESAPGRGTHLAFTLPLPAAAP